MTKTLEKEIKMTEDKAIDAGDFSLWLEQITSAFRHQTESDVPCGECVGCCSSSQFITLSEGEYASLEDRHSRFLTTNPFNGLKMIAFTKKGLCPFLVEAKCTIYTQRPTTCRCYDCRIFAAAGISAGDQNYSLINDRAKRWEFKYSSAAAKEKHEAIKNAALWIRGHFAEKTLLVENSIFLAMLAIKHHEKFVKDPDPVDEAVRNEIWQDIQRNQRR